MPKKKKTPQSKPASILIGVATDHVDYFKDHLADLKSSGLPAFQQSLYIWLTTTFLDQADLHNEFMASMVRQNAPGFIAQETKINFRCPPDINWMLRQHLLKVGYKLDQTIYLKDFYNWAFAKYRSSKTLRESFAGHLHILCGQKLVSTQRR